MIDKVILVNLFCHTAQKYNFKLTMNAWNKMEDPYGKSAG